MQVWKVHDNSCLMDLMEEKKRSEIIANVVFWDYNYNLMNAETKITDEQNWKLSEKNKFGPSSYLHEIYRDIEFS